ncbi:hypothetical protein QJS10_CPA10g01263 [Acorus calamus]|uniref:Mutator-like transposase n=1 Tax=Acorus calamus TaxID=4465 RepID=A0AAV9E4X0_ACOCL|nr:hypothetical protein QJS10_CPA10g01263 [Acorus calamus]
MDEDTLYKVTFVYDGYWKSVKSAHGHRYVQGRQFTEILDSDKIALIDLWDDIGPWSKSSNPQHVSFTYMVPNSMPKQYIEINIDSRLLQIFKENNRTKRFTLYVVQKEDAALSISHMPTSEIASERGDNEVLQQVTDNVDDLEVQDDLYGQQEDRVLNAIDKGDSDAEEDFEADSEEESDKENEMEDAQDGEDEHEEDVVLPNSVSCSDHEVSSDRFEGEFVEIDSERPKVVVGSRFPSVDHFRDALKQHCVTNEFEVKVQKARTKAIELIHGKPAESYRLIPELREEILKANLNTLITRIRGLDICDFVHEYYSLERFRLFYAIPIGALASRDQWEKVELPFTVGPPKTVRPRGRPRKNRIRDPNEKKKRRHMCTLCKEYGHHRSSCKNPIGISQRGEVGGRDRRRGRGRGRSMRFIHRDDGQVSGVACNTQSHSVGVQRSNMGGTPEMGQGQGFRNGINISTRGGGVRRGKTLGVKPSGRAISKAPKERVKCPAKRGGGAIQNIGTQSSNI